MAERRMFAKSVVDSDNFVEMAASAQALYFHLSMRADDDGFVGSPKIVTRMIGSSEKDMKQLIQNGYIIPFDSGVIAIAHWRINNQIRNDRYNATIYQTEKTMLVKDENKQYVLCGIPNDNQRETQYSIDKYSIDKVSIDKVSISATPSPRTASFSQNENVDYRTVIDTFNKICVSLPKVQSVTEERKKHIKALKDTIEENGGFEAFFKRVEASDFLCGRSDKVWKCGFDWIMKRSNAIKIIEGSYDNQTQKSYKRKYDPSSYEGLTMDIHKE